MTDTQNLDANEDIRETAKSLDEMVQSIEKMRKLILGRGKCRAGELGEIAVTITGYVSTQSPVTIEILICGVTIKFSFTGKKIEKKSVECKITVTDKEGNNKCDPYNLSASEHPLEHTITTIIQIMTQKDWEKEMK